MVKAELYAHQNSEEIQKAPGYEGVKKQNKTGALFARKETICEREGGGQVSAQHD